MVAPVKGLDMLHEHDASHRGKFPFVGAGWDDGLAAWEGLEVGIVQTDQRQRSDWPETEAVGVGQQPAEDELAELRWEVGPERRRRRGLLKQRPICSENLRKADLIPSS
jgi:hypothetical protein